MKFQPSNIPRDGADYALGACIYIYCRYMDYVFIYTVYLGEVGNRGPGSFVHIFIYNLCNMGFEDIRLKCDIDEVKMMAPFARH